MAVFRSLVNPAVTHEVADDNEAQMARFTESRSWELEAPKPKRGRPPKRLDSELEVAEVVEADG